MIGGAPMSRIRVRSDYGPVTQNYYYTGHGMYGGVLPFTDTTSQWYNGFRFYEMMEDYLSTDHRYHDTKVTQRQNPVIHKKMVYRGGYLQTFPTDYGSHNQQLGSVLPMIEPAIIDSLIPIPLPSLRETLCLEAFNDFSTQFPQEMSLAEFTGGLFELKQLIPKLQGDFVKDLAALHLTNEFGWQSLLSDLDTLSKVLDRTRDRLSWLRERYGKPSKLAFFRKDVIAPTLGSSVYVEPVRSVGFRYVLTSYQCDFRAGATLTQTMTHLDDAVGLVRGLTGAFGLDNPVKSFWELIPFSFVVDYFFPISSQLDRLTRVQPAEPWELSKVSHSFKTTATVEVIQVADHQLGGPYYTEYPLGHVSVSYYDRGVGLPVSLATLSPTSLSPDQLVLLLAIFAGSK